MDIAFYYILRYLVYIRDTDLTFLNIISWQKLLSDSGTWTIIFQPYNFG